MIEFNPLPPEITIQKSDIHGLGLFTTEAIGPGILGISHVKGDPDIFLDGYVRTTLGGIVNHSDRPNCELKPGKSGKIKYLVARRHIAAGKELTVKYGEVKKDWGERDAES